VRDEDFDFNDEDGVAGPDEVLDTGPRRPVPRWVITLIVGLLLIGFGGVQLYRGHHTNRSATPSTGPSSGIVESPAPEPTVTPSPATASLSEVYAVIPDNTDSRLYALAGQHLYALRTNSSEQAESPVLRTGGADDTNDELVLDAVHDIVWVVPQYPAGNGSTARGALEGFDGRTMKLVHRIPLVGPVGDAAVLDGRLYLLGGRRLLQVRPQNGSFRNLAPTDAAAFGLTADPVRHRLLVVESAQTPVVHAFAHGRLGPAVTLPYTRGQVVVVGSTIWAGGSTAGTAVLTRLDPRTLRSDANLARRADFDRDASLDSSGVHSLFVINGNGDQITCLDGVTARVLHRFPPADGTFVSVSGIGFDASAAALHRVPMGRCPG
jgi:hypothetical protein